MNLVSMSFYPFEERPAAAGLLGFGDSAKRIPSLVAWQRPTLDDQRRTATGSRIWPTEKADAVGRSLEGVNAWKKKKRRIKNEQFTKQSIK